LLRYSFNAIVGSVILCLLILVLLNLMEAQDDFFCQSFLHHFMRHYRISEMTILSRNDHFG
jgi:hypothetical protein